MKKIFLILAICSIQKCLYAQYTTFPIGKAIWRAEETNVVLLRTTSSTYPNASSRQDIRFYYQGGDTLIKDKIYKKISEKVRITNLNYDSAYYGAMREDIASKKVYFKGKDWTNELLLFNFDLKIGDTIRGWYTLDSLPNTTYFIVKKITNGKYTNNSKIDRRIFELEAFGLPTWATFHSYSGLLYEGIGFGNGLFKSPINSTKYQRQFRQSCFYDGVFELRNCESLTSVEEMISNKNSFTLYPNPVAETITIKSSLQIAKLVVYQSNGIKVLESHATENLDVTALPTGLYLLEAIDDKGSRLIRKFEKK